MNVVYAMTRNVYEWILPSIRSLAEHNPEARVFILAEDDELPFDLPMPAEVINVTGQAYFPEDGVNYKSYFSYINLLKVRYPSLLPVDKVIHLDTDTIICESLRSLFDMDLTDKWFAACPEYWGNYRLVGDRYYNAGVMVINLAQMREDGIEAEMTDYLNTSRQPFADQNAWNQFGVTAGKAVPFDIRWNESMVTGFTSKPAVVHYCGVRDWFTNPDTFRAEYMQKYLKPVLFASTKPFDNSESLRPVYDAFQGPKEYVQVDPWRHHPDIRSGKYGLMVCDEFPTESPGTVIYVGHGFHGCKLGGLDQTHPYHSAEFSRLIDYAVCAGEETVGITASSCGIPESSVLPLGSAKTDIYFGKCKGDGGTELAGKRAYFYVPTYRTAEETPMPAIDWQWLDDRLTDDELLAVRPHPMTGKILSGTYRHIKEYPPDGPMAAYLYDCDVVITDYSSCLIDGYLLGKPCVLFEKVSGYTETRGMYLRYPEEYSSRYAANEEQLLELIRSAEGLTKTEKDCVRKLAGSCDGHSAERICSLIRSLI